MNTLTRPIVRVLLFAAMFAVVTGCTVYERKYPGRTADQVWSAMVAVANEPNYESEKWGKWHVTKNEVWVDEENARIEMFRELRRVVYKAGMVKPDDQDRTYRITVNLRDSEIPRVRFETRAWEIPADAFAESQRYFDDVGELLEIMPMLAEPAVTTAPAEAPVAEPAPTEAPSAEEAPETVDIDEME